VPIIFVVVIDPVAAGYVDSLTRPGGNATGFMNFEFSLGGKWLELLKQIAPGVTRAAVLRESGTSGVAQFAAMQTIGAKRTCPRASGAGRSDENDPLRKSGGQNCCDAQHGFLSTMW
jgi:putative ABC transport system substrate-binding protein